MTTWLCVAVLAQGATSPSASNRCQPDAFPVAGTSGGLCSHATAMKLPDASPHGSDQHPGAGSDARVEMPPVRDTASLVLFALGTLGAGQLARMARSNFALHPIPDWYHTGGPVQVGHRTVFDFDALPVLVFPEAPAAAAPGLVFGHPDLDRHFQSCAYLTAVNPRGPPLDSLS